MLGIINRYDKLLRESGVYNSRRNVEIMLSKILNCRRADLYLQQDRPLTNEQFEIFEDYIRLRRQRLPIEYILEETEFFGLKLKIKPAVFIPRPETEILVEKAAEVIKKIEIEKGFVSICEIGSGSGNISLSLAGQFKNCKIIATDISEAALNLSKQNFKRYRIDGQIAQLGANLFFAFKKKGIFDIILANLPYVAEEDFRSLSKEVRFEPRQALSGGKKGIEILKRFIREAGFYLKSGGYIILEIGLGQSKAVKKMLLQTKQFQDIKIYKDYSDIERVICAKWIN